MDQGHLDKELTRTLLENIDNVSAELDAFAKVMDENGILVPEEPTFMALEEAKSVIAIYRDLLDQSDLAPYDTLKALQQNHFKLLSKITDVGLAQMEGFESAGENIKPLLLSGCDQMRSLVGIHRKVGRHPMLVESWTKMPRPKKPEIKRMSEAEKEELQRPWKNFFAAVEKLGQASNKAVQDNARKVDELGETVQELKVRVEAAEDATDQFKASLVATQKTVEEHGMGSPTVIKPANSTRAYDTVEGGKSEGDDHSPSGP
jgi:hypothetical protein